MTTQAEWLQKALRSQAIAAKIADLLNEMEPNTVDAQIYGPGFCIRGFGGNFHVDSLLSANDLRPIPDGHRPPTSPEGTSS
ncbi:hypothetical protein ACFQ0X_43750 [Streptomyces rectiviolaceus]|uniref:Uncharacterized protein n=1 Tax=Streptomyces rectiviolaceus TaxID=332591 RepID=A0ABP6NLY4_9ACTN